jgi:hypothetical protein
MDTDRILDKLDKIQEHQLKHSELLARHTVLHEANTKSLDLHIKRTDLLELKLEADMKTALLPINSIKWILKVAAGIIVILTLAKFL